MLLPCFHTQVQNRQFFIIDSIIYGFFVQFTKATAQKKMANKNFQTYEPF